MINNEVNKIIADDKDRLFDFLPQNIGFRKIKEVSGYYICSDGEVVSTKHGKLKYLKQHPGNSGYLKVTFSVNNKSLNFMTHKLVAKYFISDPPEGEQVNHKDGNKKNNNIKNLEYVTRYENMRHARDMGLLRPVYGEKNHFSKISDEEAEKIKSLYFKSRAFVLGYFYNISESQVRNILRGDSRSNINNL